MQAEVWTATESLAYTTHFSDDAPPPNWPHSIFTIGVTEIKDTDYTPKNIFMGVSSSE